MAFAARQHALIERCYAGDLPAHTLFLADDYCENFESIIRDLSIPRNPSLCVHAPRQVDASSAPAGEETLIAIVPVGHLSANEDQDWTAIRDEALQPRQGLYAWAVS